MNNMPSPRREKEVVVSPKASKHKNHTVWKDLWFTLKKFELKKKHPIDDSKLPLKVRKAVKKLEEDGFIDVDVEKAMMIANAQGVASNVNMQLGNISPQIGSI